MKITYYVKLIVTKKLGLIRNYTCKDYIPNLPFNCLNFVQPWQKKKKEIFGLRRFLKTKYKKVNGKIHYYINLLKIYHP